MNTHDIEKQIRDRIALGQWTVSATQEVDNGIPLNYGFRIPKIYSEFGTNDGTRLQPRP